jgi:hypothetical protein
MEKRVPYIVVVCRVVFSCERKWRPTTQEQLQVRWVEVMVSKFPSLTIWFPKLEWFRGSFFLPKKTILGKALPKSLIRRRGVWEWYWDSSHSNHFLGKQFLLLYEREWEALAAQSNFAIDYWHNSQLKSQPCNFCFPSGHIKDLFVSQVRHHQLHTWPEKMSICTETV